MKPDAKTPQLIENLYLDGAGLPVPPATVLAYERKLTTFMEAAPFTGRTVFSVLTSLFEETARQVFGAQLSAFYTQGTLTSFQKWVLRFWQVYPEARCISTPLEYMPMYYNLPRRFRHMVDLPDLYFREEDLTAAFFAKGDALNRGLTESEKRNRPICLLVSSEPRCGGKRLDMNKISDLVAQQNAALGYRQYHLWTDASQDFRTLRKTDVLWYSKRHAGTGGGMILVNNQTYDLDNSELREAVRVRSGYDIRYIIRLIASLLSMKSRMLYGLTQRINQVGEAEPGTKPVSLRGEINAAVRAFNRNPALQQNFRLIVNEEKPPFENGEMHAILRLELSEQGRDRIDLFTLEQALQAERVTIGHFSLDHCNGSGSVGYDDVVAAYNAEPFDLRHFVDVVEQFQHEYQDYLVRTLIPVDNRENREWVRSHFYRAVLQHEYYRIFISVAHPPGTLRRFIQHLERAVDHQLGATDIRVSA